MITSQRRDSRLTALRAERDDLLRSLSDLEAERVAGDLTDADHEELRRDYISRTSALLRAIEALETSGADGASQSKAMSRVRRMLGRSRSRRAIIVLLVAWVLIAVSLVGLHFAGVRLPGQSATGSISLSEALVVQTELTQASDLAGAGNISQAISVYEQVLTKVPNQHEALTYQGWLIRLSGLAAHRSDIVARGDAELARAVAVAPGYPDARGLDAVALFDDRHEKGAALTQARAMLADHPAASLVAALRTQLVSIYESAHVAPPRTLSGPAHR